MFYTHVRFARTRAFMCVCVCQIAHTVLIYLRLKSHILIVRLHVSPCGRVDPKAGKQLHPYFSFPPAFSFCFFVLRSRDRYIYREYLSARRANSYSRAILMIYSTRRSLCAFSRRPSLSPVTTVISRRRANRSIYRYKHEYARMSNPLHLSGGAS